MRYGLKKPVLLTEEKELKMRLLKTNPGDAIIFDDELLHGGHINNGEKTRVSMEFTALVKKTKPAPIVRQGLIKSSLELGK